MFTSEVAEPVSEDQKVIDYVLRLNKVENSGGMKGAFVTALQEHVDEQGIDTVLGMRLLLQDFVTCCELVESRDHFIEEVVFARERIETVLSFSTVFFASKRAVLRALCAQMIEDLERVPAIPEDQA